MKKKLLVVAMLIVVIMTAVLLVGCNTQKMTLGFMTSADGDIEYVKVNIEEYEGKMLFDFLKAEETLGAKMEDSGYGPYLTEIKNLKPNPENQYISVFTSDESKKDTSEWAAQPIVKDDVTYYYSNYGIKDLPISKDVKYLFVLMTW